MKLLRSINWNIIFTSILLGGLGWLWLTRARADDTSQGFITAPQKGFLSPDFSLLTTDGELITLSDLRGQPILLNIWASWCSPCRIEMPAMERTYQENKSKGYLVLAVNATNQDDLNKAIAFIKEKEITFPILLDQKGEISKLFQVRALPTSFFIDRHGIIQEVVVGGPMSEALINILVDRITQTNEKE